MTLYRERRGEGIRTLNLSFCSNTPTEWMKIGEEVAFVQIPLAEVETRPILDGGCGETSLSEGRTAIVLRDGDTVYTVDRASGAISSIVSSGRELLTSPAILTLWRAPTDNDRNIKGAWHDAGYDRTTMECRRIRVEGCSVIADVVLTLHARRPILSATLTYSLTPGAGLTIKGDVKVRAGLPPLPRLGLYLSLPEGFEHLTYFGYGPYESYRDKRLASRLGLFETTASENFEPYVRPQENGAHDSCRFAVAGHIAGQALAVFGDDFSVSFSHHSPKQLTETRHDYELTDEKTTTMIVDYRQAGIGSNSCGPALAERYRLNKSEYSFSFRLLPTRSADLDPFAESRR